MKSKQMTVFTLMVLLILLVASIQTVYARGGQGQGMRGDQQHDLTRHRFEQHHAYRYQKQNKQTMSRSSMEGAGNQNASQPRMRHKHRDPSRLSSSPGQ